MGSSSSENNKHVIGFWLFLSIEIDDIVYETSKAMYTVQMMFHFCVFSVCNEDSKIYSILTSNNI